jgi:predicted Zn-dependent peptidase
VLSSLQLLNGPGGESGRAGFLQRFNHYLANPGALDDWLASIERVSAADVKRVLAEHLRNDKRVVGITLPRHAEAKP